MSTEEEKDSVVAKVIVLITAAVALSLLALAAFVRLVAVVNKRALALPSCPFGVIAVTPRKQNWLAGC